MYNSLNRIASLPTGGSKRAPYYKDHEHKWSGPSICLGCRGLLKAKQAKEGRA